MSQQNCCPTGNKNICFSGCMLMRQIKKPNGGFETLNFKPPFPFFKKEYAGYAKVAS